MKKTSIFSGIFLMVCALVTPVPAQSPGMGGRRTGPGHNRGGTLHRFQDAERWADRFESRDRDAWQKPDEIITAMGILPTSKIADIGSATGYFSVRFARAAGEGFVYGIDIEPDMVRYLNERAKKEGIGNLRSLLGQSDDPKIPEPVDFIFLCNTYHHIQDRERYFTHLKKYLRAGGKLVIVDRKEGFGRMGLPKEQIIEELTRAGYRLLPSDLQLPRQYYLVFEPGAEPH